MKITAMVIGILGGLFGLVGVYLRYSLVVQEEFWGRKSHHGNRPGFCCYSFGDSRNRRRRAGFFKT